MKKKWPSLCVIKEIKANGKVDIEKSYYGMTKIVIRKNLKPYRCEWKNHTRRNNHKLWISGVEVSNIKL